MKRETITTLIIIAIVILITVGAYYKSTLPCPEKDPLGLFTACKPMLNTSPEAEDPLNLGI